MSLVSESKQLLSKFIQNPLLCDYLSPSIPFRIFRSHAQHSDILNPKLCLPFNRFTDLTAFTKASRISIWSQSHLVAIKSMVHTNKIDIDNVILKNPYKTQQLIKQSIDIGLKSMVVDSFDQLSKIHEIRCANKRNSQQYAPINFIWKVSDLENHLKQLQTLTSYNIRIGGLIFDEELVKNKSQITKFIEKLNKQLGEKRRITNVILQTKTQDCDAVSQAYQKDQFFVKNRIKTVLEKTNFSMTSKYFIAARIIGQNRKKESILNEEAYDYLGAEQIKKGEMIQEGLGKKWIFSPISFFPELKVMEEHQRKGYIISAVGEESRKFAE